MISLPIPRNVVSHERSRCSPLPSRNDRFSSDRKGSLPFGRFSRGYQAQEPVVLSLAKKYGVRSEAVQDDTCHLVLDLGAHR